MQDKVCRDCSNDKSLTRKRDFVKEIYALSFSLVEWTKAPQDKREELEGKRRIKRLTAKVIRLGKRKAPA